MKWYARQLFIKELTRQSKATNRDISESWYTK